MNFLDIIKRKRFRPSDHNTSLGSNSPVKERFPKSIELVEDEKTPEINRLIKYSEPNTDRVGKMNLTEFKDEVEYGWIISLTENRAREIGFAWINLWNFAIELTQISDSQTYVNTCKSLSNISVTLLHNYSPIEIVMPHSLQESGLCLRIKEDLQDSEDLFKFIRKLNLSFLERKVSEKLIWVAV